MTNDVCFEQRGHIGLITLQRVQALNALTLAMIHALQNQLEYWQADNNIHAIVIQAAAGKAFCAGGDVRFLYGHRHDRAQQMQFFLHEYRLNHFISQLNKPYIALMDGFTMGGGVGISLHGSHPIASERFVFAMPETGIGFFPDIGASYLLSRCSHQIGLYLGLTGHRIGAGDAKACGLVKHILPSEQFQTLLSQLVEMDLSADAHARVDARLKHFEVGVLPTPVMDLHSTIETCFASFDVESTFKNLVKSNEGWHISTLKDLYKKSPLSLKITAIQIQKASLLSLKKCLQMDYGLAAHFMEDHDFYEGVRALLVDKDQNPQWQPNSLSLVTNKDVERYFESAKPELPFE